MTVEKKIEAWKQKLLDTGRGNKLINFKQSVSSTLEIVNDDFFEIFNNLGAGFVYEFAPLFESLDEFEFDDDVLTKVVSAQGDLISRKDRYTKEEIKKIIPKFKPKKNKRYLFSTTITNLELRALRLLKRKSNMFYDETGVNALYFCFGFLKWKDPIDKTVMNSPIAMLPIRIYQNNIKDTMKIAAIDDDFILNETLIYRFKQEFKINLRPEEEMTLEEYVAFVNDIAIKNGFEFVYDLAIGLLSFTKMRMYVDLEENKELILQNPIVNALADQNEDLNSDLKREHFLVENQNLILKADSSQYQAIEAAKNGISFVLQGPPGTGKSQTITNMLAELIALDKKVLFVCEKKAALDVVYSNLKKRGLSQFCLALHDPKTNKKEVVTDLITNLEKTSEQRVKMNDRINQVYDKIEVCGNNLEEYNAALHRIRKPINKSLYELFEQLQTVKQYEEVSLKFEHIEEISFTDFQKMCSTISTYLSSIEELGCLPEEHYFYGVSEAYLSNDAQNKFKKILSDIKFQLINLKSAILGFEQYDFFPCDSIADYRTILEFVEIAHALKDVDYRYFSYHDNEQMLAQLEDCSLQAKEMFSMQKNLLKKYKMEVFELEHQKIFDSLNLDFSSSIKRMLSSEYKKIIKSITLCLKEYQKLSYEEVLYDLKSMIEYQKNLANLEHLKKPFMDKYADIFDLTEDGFLKMKHILSNLLKFENVEKKIKKIDKNFELRLRKMLEDKEFENTIYNIANKDQLEYSKFESSFEELKKFVDFSEVDFASYDINYFIFRINNMQNNFYTLQSYMNYLKVMNSVIKNYPFLLDLLTNHSLEAKNMENVFVKSFLTSLIEKIISQEDILMNFNKSIFMQYMSDYRLNQNQLLELSKTKIVEQVTQSWPNITGLMATNKELKILLTEANKKRKLKPLRALFQEINNILVDLKPIFMMSPLSVSMFLDPKIYQFDCVIFDEASQITTENAALGLYRAKQVIVVGDNEQLPPTSFFSNDIEDEEDVEYNVYESVLDECRTCLPQIMLKWHYRSKDESLIAFSNKEIYHDLVTFPSPTLNSDALGVHYEYVENGIYEKGVRINRQEAKKAVELVFEHFRKTPEKSLGIVTFNQAQQSLIENLINRKRREDNSFEEFFDEMKENAFFIKNLETVQGDERDCIILSIGFAKGINGKLSMNFGPINQNGGYRRLNVAITRAKEKVILLGSILPEDFDLSKTESRGVCMLKNYIEFAINKGRLATYATNFSEDAILTDIKKSLKDFGYEADINIGFSSFKIDLAIKDKDKYILAILADGHNYHNFTSTNDRIVLRKEVLENCGWNVYELFSPSYVLNPRSEIEFILKAIENAKENKKTIVEDAYETTDYIDVMHDEAIDAKLLFDYYPDPAGCLKKAIELENNISDKLISIMQDLAPIKIEVLKKLVLPLYDKPKMTKAVAEMIEQDISSLLDNKRFYKVIGYVLKPADLLGVKFRRHNEENETTRDIKDVYIEELESGIFNILSIVREMAIESLFHQMNVLMGYQKMSDKIRNVYQSVLSMMLDKNMIVINNNVITLIV